MANLSSPYDSPYLPPFVRQQQRLSNRPIQPPQFTQPGLQYVQIQSVNGFEGARNYASSNLAAGSSNIVAESDSSLSRIYIVAKDSNGQLIVEGYDLLRVVEPKPTTLDDLNAKMSEILTRINKLEEDSTSAKPISNPISENVSIPKQQTSNAGSRPAGIRSSTANSGAEDASK